MTQALDTTLSTAHVVMEAGQEREAEILVRNHGDEMDQFTVQVLGPAAAWTTVVPSVVTVPAGEEEWVRVVYAPPRNAEARQGKSHVAFRITSYNDPTTSTLEEAVVEVAAFAELEVRLDPPQRRTTRRGRFLLTAVNRGNSPVRCQANAYGLDEGEGLDILIAGPEFVSEPGSTTQLPVRVQARRRFMRGQDQSLSFAVEVNGDILERPAMVEGVLNQEPILSTARTKLLVAAVLLLALVLGGWFTWYSLASDEEPLGGSNNGQLVQTPGTPQAPVLGEAGVAGVSGSAGLPGLPGAAGNQGLAGEAGAAGLAGAAGAVGDAGAVGAAGTAGAAGKDGVAGAAGEAGTQGAPGLPGLVGDKGDTGAEGTDGTDGAAGANGTVVMGQVQSYSNLPVYTSPADVGKAWLVQDDGLLYTWNGTAYPKQGEGVEFRGAAGTNGNNGTSLSVQGEVPTYAALPTGLTAADAGKGWIVTEDGQLYMWSGKAFPAEGMGVPFRSVAAPLDLVLNASAPQPQTQPFQVKHFVRSGTSQLYYLRVPTATLVNDIALTDVFGGTSKLTIDQPGPGTGDVIDAKTPWSSELLVDPSHPLLVELKCSPTDPTNINAGCGASLAVSYRAPVDTKITLPSPTDTVTPSPATTVVHHQIPKGATSTIYTVDAPGDDTEITAITATPGFGGTASIAVGPADNATRPVVTAAQGQVFGATATPATSETLVVTRNNPLTLTVTCAFAAPATTCGSDLTFSVRRPVPRTLPLPAATDAPQTVQFDVVRSALAGSSARYALAMPAPDAVIQSISLVDAVGSGSSVTFSPGSAQTVVTATGQAAPNSPSWSGTMPVYGGTPLPVEFACSTADAARGCAGKLSVTYARPAPTTVDLAVASPQGTATTDQVFTYNRAAGDAGRYTLVPTADTEISKVTVKNNVGGTTVRLFKNNVLIGTVVGGQVNVGELVGQANPVYAEVTCATLGQSCASQFDITTTPPRVADSLYMGDSKPYTIYARYDARAFENGTGVYQLSPPNKVQGNYVTGVTVAADDPTTTVFFGPTRADQTRASATPASAWSGSIYAGSDYPLAINLRCPAAKADLPCAAAITFTVSPAPPAPLPFDNSTVGSTGGTFTSTPSYDPKTNNGGNYEIYPSKSGDSEVVQLSVQADSAVRAVILPNGQSVGSGATWTGSIFVNDANRLPISVRCVDAAAGCTAKLTTTIGAPLTTITMPYTQSGFLPIAPVVNRVPARYLLRTDATSVDLNSYTFYDNFATVGVNSQSFASLDIPALGASQGDNAGGFFSTLQAQVPVSPPVRISRNRPIVLTISCNQPACAPSLSFGSSSTP